MKITEFVNVLREDELLLLMFLEYVNDKFFELIPQELDIEDLDEKVSDEDLVKVIDCVSAGRGDGELNNSIVSKIVKIFNLYNQAAGIFHEELYQIGIDLDMGDELADIFGPLLERQFNELLAG